MSTQTPAAAVQDENIHIHRGKGIDGVKADALRPKFKLANQTPIVQNENLQSHRGKGIDGLKKPDNKARKDRRKALADLSSVKKPPHSGTSKGLVPKEKSGVRSSETTKKVPETDGLTDDGIGRCEEWTNGLTDEQIKKCKEWAKEGIEQCHFTGNDAQKLDKDIQEELVRKEVEMVMSCMREWNQMAYDWGMPPSEESYEEDIDIGVVKKLLEPVPELPFPPRRRSLSISDDEDPFLGVELLPFFPPYSDDDFPSLKEEAEDDDDDLIF